MQMSCLTTKSVFLNTNTSKEKIFRFDTDLSIHNLLHSEIVQGERE